MKIECVVPKRDNLLVALEQSGKHYPSDGCNSSTSGLYPEANCPKFALCKVPESCVGLRREPDLTVF